MKAYPMEKHSNKYRLFFEESFTCEKDGGQGDEKPWSAEFRGNYGTVSPHSEKEMAVYTHSRIQRKKLKQMGLKIRQWGEDEATFTFGPDRLDEVPRYLN